MKPYLFGRKVQTYYGGNILHALFTGTSNMKTKNLIDLFLSRFIGGSRVTLAVGICSMSKPWEFQLTQSVYSDFFTIWLDGKIFQWIYKEISSQGFVSLCVAWAFWILEESISVQMRFFHARFPINVGCCDTRSPVKTGFTHDLYIRENVVWKFALY